MSDEDLLFESAVSLAARIRAGEISAAELTRAYVDRAERLNPALNAYITIAGDEAMAAARAADARPRDATLPPFHGVPVSIKDLIDTAGIRTTMGTASYSERVPDIDSPPVAALKRAGFIVMGKSNTAEFGVGSTDPIAYGPCRNPWDLERTTGGSSGGAAATAAAAMCGASLGGDGGGSARIPAAFCGVVGLKPSRGRVSSAPKPQSMLGQVSPMARSVHDVAGMLDALAGPGVGDAYWAAPPERPFLESAAGRPAPLRIACTAETPGEEATPANVAAIEEARRMLEDAGHEVVDAKPDWPGLELDAPLYALYAAGFIATEDDLPPLDTMDPIFATLFQYVRGFSLKDYLVAERRMFEVGREVAAFFEGHDLLLMPTVTMRPVPVSTLRQPGSDSASILATSLWNMSGQPAVSIPVGFDAEGLPVGVQLVGRPWGEATMLAAAAQLEVAAGWPGLRPTMRGYESLAAPARAT